MNRLYLGIKCIKYSLIYIVSDVIREHNITTNKNIISNGKQTKCLLKANVIDLDYNKGSKDERLDRMGHLGFCQHTCMSMLYSHCKIS